VRTRSELSRKQEVSNAYRLGLVPPTLRRVRRDNVTLIPGNLLARRMDWQRIANRLPANAILIVLPSSRPAQRRALLASASLLARKGHQIRVVSAEDL
jgi:hypothetical protein